MRIRNRYLHSDQMDCPWLASFPAQEHGNKVTLLTHNSFIHSILMMALAVAVSPRA